MAGLSAALRRAEGHKHFLERSNLMLAAAAKEAMHGQVSCSAATNSLCMQYCADPWPDNMCAARARLPQTGQAPYSPVCNPVPLEIFSRGPSPALPTSPPRTLSTGHPAQEPQGVCVAAEGLQNWDPRALLQLREAWPYTVCLTPAHIVGLTLQELSRLWQVRSCTLWQCKGPPVVCWGECYPH